MLSWAGPACTIAKWCLLISVRSTSRATRPTSNSFEEATSSESGASMAFASDDCRKRRLSVLVTSAMPSSAARLYFCRSNGTFYPIVVVCAETTHDGKRSSTVSACGSPKQRPCNFPRGVYGAIVQMLTDLVARPAQRESKEQGCSTTLERGSGVEVRPTSDFVTRPEGPRVTAYGFKWC